MNAESGRPVRTTPGRVDGENPYNAAARVRRIRTSFASEMAIPNSLHVTELPFDRKDLCWQAATGDRTIRPARNVHHQTKQKTRQPHFEFAALISIRVLDAVARRDSQFCLESLACSIKRPFRVQVAPLKRSPQQFTLADETTRNEHNSTERNSLCHQKSAAFSEPAPSQKTLQNSPPEVRCFGGSSDKRRNSAGR